MIFLCVTQGTVVTTNVARHLSPWMQTLFRTMMMFSTKTVAEGAASSVHCSLAPRGELQVQGSSHSNYLYVNCQPQELTTAVAKDLQVSEALWEKAEQLCLGACPAAKRALLGQD